MYGALQHAHGLATRSTGQVAVHVAIIGLVWWYLQGSVPQGTRTQQRRRVVHGFDLPVQTGIGRLPARIAQRGLERGLALGVLLEGGGELVELVQQLRVELARHVLAEQPRQKKTRQQQRHGDGHAGGGQQPPTQVTQPGQQGQAPVGWALSR